MSPKLSLNILNRPSKQTQFYVNLLLSYIMMKTIRHLVLTSDYDEPGKLAPEMNVNSISLLVGHPADRHFINNNFETAIMAL